MNFSLWEDFIVSCKFGYKSRDFEYLIVKVANENRSGGFSWQPNGARARIFHLRERNFQRKFRREAAGLFSGVEDISLSSETSASTFSSKVDFSEDVSVHEG